MPPNEPQQNQDNVWISREEYERLRSVAARAPDTSSNGIQYGWDNGGIVNADPVTAYTDHSVSEKMADQQKMALLFLAIGLILSLSISGIGFLAPLFGSILTIFGFVSIFSYANQRKKENGQSQGVKQPPGVARTLLIITGIVLMIPVLGFFAMIMLMIFFMGLSGGRGS